MVSDRGNAYLSTRPPRAITAGEECDINIRMLHTTKKKGALLERA